MTGMVYGLRITVGQDIIADGEIESAGALAIKLDLRNRSRTEDRFTRVHETGGKLALSTCTIGIPIWRDNGVCPGIKEIIYKCCRSVDQAGVVMHDELVAKQICNICQVNAHCTTLARTEKWIV
jgi:hypothetical protein